ncbi:alpha/beta-hydrolase [Wolfiporia cocos MD-104 SS10]|uniref:Alpha/beta-hydrolase n=1 Tax=Wolfiporia cocos (strain MD-104) TaxID=742152 RepID=A0A2H3J793_WOLCO|nr:alpha/beta-hydrolase [Wolfiporia cocos MD-104 SS10]
MDASFYKELTTTRHIKYRYFAAPGDATLPTLFFLHGFPSTSYDWRHQVAFFRAQGYAVIAPDLLGHGGTFRPSDPMYYKYSAMSSDLIEILDAEHVDKAIAIGHDWGSTMTARLASYYPDRFSGFAFLAVGYAPTFEGFDYEAVMAQIKQALGYETYGYWQFFGEDNADQVIKAHIDSFISIIFPTDPEVWKTDLCPRGGIKAWLLADKTTPLPSYLTEEDKAIITKSWLSGGLGGALNWYRTLLTGINPEDDKKINSERHVLRHPAFFGACKKDYVCTPALALAAMEPACPNMTVREFNTGHWVQLEAAAELNAALLAWITGILQARL